MSKSKRSRTVEGIACLPEALYMILQILSEIHALVSREDQLPLPVCHRVHLPRLAARSPPIRVAEPQTKSHEVGNSTVPYPSNIRKCNRGTLD
jgi:hypothetical protein